MTIKLSLVLFDFGGVIAEEGFYQGLRAIAGASGLDPDHFFAIAEDLIHRTGYVTGRATEAEYWAAVRHATVVGHPDEYMREQILSRFILRPGMLAHADRLRAMGKDVGILSDQTDWLDEINRRTPFFDHFDRVFNSYYLHKSKRDQSVFSDICRELAVDPGEVLFIDDNVRNVGRAASAGLMTIHFTDPDRFVLELKEFGLQ